MSHKTLVKIGLELSTKRMSNVKQGKKKVYLCKNVVEVSNLDDVTFAIKNPVAINNGVSKT